MVIANSCARRSRRAVWIWPSPSRTSFFLPYTGRRCSSKTIISSAASIRRRSLVQRLRSQTFRRSHWSCPAIWNARCSGIERPSAAAGLPLNLAAQAVTVASELSAVRSGAASTILNLGDMSGFSTDDFAQPVLIEPTFYMTCCLLWSNQSTLSLGAEGVKKLLIDFLKEHVQKTKRPGAAWLD